MQGSHNNEPENGGFSRIYVGFRVKAFVEVTSANHREFPSAMSTIRNIPTSASLAKTQNLYSLNSDERSQGFKKQQKPCYLF